MSKTPTVFDPKWFFNSLLERIKSHPPSTLKADVGPHLKDFLADPTIKVILGSSKVPTAPSAPIPDTDLKMIQQSLTSLSKAITDLQKKVTPTSSPKQKGPIAETREKGKAKPPIKSYSAIAGSRPPNPSLVVDLARLELQKSSRLHPEAICKILNRKLGEVTPSQPQLAAVRWTAKGNLVVTGGPSTTSASLNSAAPHISNILSHALRLPASSTPIPQPRANVRWSKISINGVPTSASSLGDPRSPHECHEALKSHNPLYSSLTVTQRPSWVRSPSSYDVGSVSSLSVAFEDPDGGKLRALLAERYLYIYGTSITKSAKSRSC
jgi:hypothetical protein